MSGTGLPADFDYFEYRGRAYEPNYLERDCGHDISPAPCGPK